MIKTFWISRKAQTDMQDEASRMSPLETGGVLLGWQNGDNYVVNVVCGPGPKAMHKRYRFRPDGEFRKSEVIRHFYESDGENIYLGDWHTHPDQADPKLSFLDKWELGRIGVITTPKLETPLMAVLGMEKTFKLNAWYGEYVFSRWGLPLINPMSLRVKPF